MRSESYRQVSHRKVRWLRVLLVLFLFILMLATMTGVVVYAYNNLFNPMSASSGVPGSNVENTINKRINILILGVDDGDVDAPGAPKRSDTMIVASINPQDSTVNLLSIPRDTKVIIPGHKGYDKITHAFAYGGAALSVRTVQEFLHIPINYYAVLDWQGFIDIVDVLGGVDLYVENDMDYDDPYAKLGIHLSKGLQHLDGLSAGEYVRFRHDELGDIGRVQRQQRFLKVLRDQMFSFGTILKLPALTSTLRQYVTTDMPKLTMIRLANTLMGMKEASNFHTELLPGDFSANDNFGYWMPDADKTKRLVETMFSNAGDSTVIQTSDSSNKKNQASRAIQKE